MPVSRLASQSERLAAGGETSALRLAGLAAVHIVVRESTKKVAIRVPKIPDTKSGLFQTVPLPVSDVELWQASAASTGTGSACVGDSLATTSCLATLSWRPLVVLSAVVRLMFFLVVMMHLLGLAVWKAGVASIALPHEVRTVTSMAATVQGNLDIISRFSRRLDSRRRWVGGWEWAVGRLPCRRPGVIVAGVQQRSHPDIETVSK
jgi:hypothetical protein